MGILNEMFGDEKDQIPSAESVLLAQGDYIGDTDTILSGYKTFRKKYVYGKLFLKLLVVVIAFISSILMFLTSEKGDIMPVFCFLICFAAGVYFISEPINNKKKLKSGLEVLQGTEYNAKIYSDKIVIFTNKIENVETSEENIDTNTIDEINILDENEIDEENAEIPATVIHLDSPVVDFIDRNDMFIICVKKSYVFIIPKTAFSDEEINAVQEKMKIILGIRYKTA